MQTTVEETAKHTVRLDVEVPPEEFAKDLDRTYRKLAGEVKVPGFRKGHVPKQIIDARLGRDAVVDEYVGHLRERFAELDVVSRPARPGDYVLADVRASIHGREVPEATRIGYLGEVGSEELVPELDKELEGKRKGDIVRFNAVLPQKLGADVAGQEVTFSVLV